MINLLRRSCKRGGYRVDTCTKRTVRITTFMRLLPFSQSQVISSTGFFGDTPHNCCRTAVLEDPGEAR
jgi:hypothetical protein